MSAALLHYRSWQGQTRGAWWGVWPIARTSLGNLLRRKLFWVLYAASLLLFLMFFFGTYLLAWIESRLPTTPETMINLGRPSEGIIRFVRRSMQILNGSQETFAYFFLYQGSMVMVILTLAGAVLVGNDFTFRSLGFFLAKPIHRWHYILGKCLAIGVVVNLVTTLPALVLFAQNSLADWEYLADPDYFLNTGLGEGPAGLPLLLGILAFGMLLTGFLSILLVATAGWVRRTLPLVMVWAGLFFFLRSVASLLVDGLKYDARWRLLDLWNSICLLGYGFLGYGHERWPTTNPQPHFVEAAIVLLGVTAICVVYLHRRIRSVEIVT